MNVITRYLDLRNQTGKLRKRPVAERELTDAVPSALGVWMQYLAIVLGIIVQKYWSQFHSTGQWDFAGLWGWLLFALITALVIFPAVYKNTMDPTQPLFVQFCLVFTAGMGWQALVSNVLPT